jgi:hypothetical protein
MAVQTKECNCFAVRSALGTSPNFGTGRIAHDPILHSGTAETDEAADDRRSCARPGDGPHDAWSQHPPAGAGWLDQDRTCRVGPKAQFGQLMELANRHNVKARALSTLSAVALS